MPAWPFVVGSFAFGIFALGPFFALWTPMKDEHHAQLGPPAKKDLVKLLPLHLPCKQDCKHACAIMPLESAAGLTTHC